MTTRITIFLITLILGMTSDLDQDFDKTFRMIFDMFKKNTDLSKEVSLKFTVKEINKKKNNTSISNVSFKVSGPASEADALHEEAIKRTQRIKKMVKNLTE